MGPNLYYTIVLLLLGEDTNSVIIGVADLMRCMSPQDIVPMCIDEGYQVRS